MPAAPKGRDWALLAFMVLTWGSSFLFIKLTLGWLGPFWLAAFRLMAASLFFALVRPLIKGQWPQGRQWLPLAILGFVGNAMPFILIGLATQTIPSSAAALIMSASPMIVMILGIVLLPDEGINLSRVVGIVGGLLGVVLIILGARGALSGSWSTSIVPYLLVLGAAAGYAMVNIFGRRLGSLSLFARSFGMLSTGALSATVFAFFLEPLPTSFEPIPALMTLHLGTVASGIAMFALLHLMDRTSSGFASLTNYLVPMVAIVLGSLLLGEQLTLVQYAGAALVLAAVWLASRAPRPAPSV